MENNTQTLDINTEENASESFKYMIALHFKGSKKAYHFGTNDNTIRYGDHVVVETIRGLEMGETIGELRDTSEHVINTPLKPILRKADEQDEENFLANKKHEPIALEKCQECIKKLNLDMNLISAEYTLDRTKVIFSYVSDERVDFRELLKELAAIFKCRIELRQIGPRDKAKLIGGIGSCGMECCCSRFLDEFDVVSVNMAKNQLLALNIEKLSGQCGKLMCCLRYEDDIYKEARKGMPKMNARLMYHGNTYRLTGMNIMDETCRLSNKEESITITTAELKAIMDDQEFHSQPSPTQTKPSASSRHHEKMDHSNVEKTDNKNTLSKEERNHHEHKNHEPRHDRNSNRNEHHDNKSKHAPNVQDMPQEPVIGADLEGHKTNTSNNRRSRTHHNSNRRNGGAHHE